MLLLPSFPTLWMDAQIHALVIWWHQGLCYPDQAPALALAVPHCTCSVCQRRKQTLNTATSCCCKLYLHLCLAFWLYVNQCHWGKQWATHAWEQFSRPSSLLLKHYKLNFDCFAMPVSYTTLWGPADSHCLWCTLKCSKAAYLFINQEGMHSQALPSAFWDYLFEVGSGYC